VEWQASVLFAWHFAESYGRLHAGQIDLDLNSSLVESPAKAPRLVSLTADSKGIVIVGISLVLLLVPCRSWRSSRSTLIMRLLLLCLDLFMHVMRPLPSELWWRWVLLMSLEVTANAVSPCSSRSHRMGAVPKAAATAPTTRPKRLKAITPGAIIAVVVHKEPSPVWHKAGIVCSLLLVLFMLPPIPLLRRFRLLGFFAWLLQLRLCRERCCCRGWGGFSNLHTHHPPIRGW
jgi:hypothetical protein